MEWKKAKWLIIAFLLAVNLFLAVNIGIKYAHAQKTLKTELSDAVSLARDLPGFSEETFSSLPVYLYSYYSRRGLLAEKALAQALLSTTAEPLDTGGGITLYRDNDYYLTFRRGGDTEGALSPDKADGKTLSRVLKNAGIKNAVRENGISFLYRGLSISNAGLQTKGNDEFYSFSGTIPLSDGWTRKELSLSRGELVLALANYVRELSAGQLKSVSASYLLSSSGAQDLYLTPVITAACEKGVIVISMTDKTLISYGN